MFYCRAVMDLEEAFKRPEIQERWGGVLYAINQYQDFNEAIKESAKVEKRLKKAAISESNEKLFLISLARAIRHQNTDRAQFLDDANLNLSYMLSWRVQTLDQHRGSVFGTGLAEFPQTREDIIAEIKRGYDGIPEEGEITEERIALRQEFSQFSYVAIEMLCAEWVRAIGYEALDVRNRFLLSCCPQLLDYMETGVLKNYEDVTAWKLLYHLRDNASQLTSLTEHDRVVFSMLREKNLLKDLDTTFIVGERIPRETLTRIKGVLSTLDSEVWYAHVELMKRPLEGPFNTKGHPSQKSSFWGDVERCSGDRLKKIFGVCDPVKAKVPKKRKGRGKGARALKPTPKNAPKQKNPLTGAVAVVDDRAVEETLSPGGGGYHTPDPDLVDDDGVVWDGGGSGSAPELDRSLGDLEEKPSSPKDIGGAGDVDVDVDVDDDRAVEETLSPGGGAYHTPDPDLVDDDGVEESKEEALNPESRVKKHKFDKSFEIIFPRGFQSHHSQMLAKAEPVRELSKAHQRFVNKLFSTDSLRFQEFEIFWTSIGGNIDSGRTAGSHVSLSYPGTNITVGTYRTKKYNKNTLKYLQAAAWLIGCRPEK